jgi:CheY-like chemotaxis protein
MPAGLIITKDLFFASKVTGTAAALGLTVRSAGSLEQLPSDDLALVILDLDCPGISPQDVMAALPAGKPIITVAFGPHVHEAQLAAAKSAGFEHVLPRSKFSATLVEILQSALHRNK